MQNIMIGMYGEMMGLAQFGEPLLQAILDKPYCCS